MEALVFRMVGLQYDSREDDTTREVRKSPKFRPRLWKLREAESPDNRKDHRTKAGWTCSTEAIHEYFAAYTCG